MITVLAPLSSTCCGEQAFYDWRNNTTLMRVTCAMQVSVQERKPLLFRGTGGRSSFRGGERGPRSDRGGFGGGRGRGGDPRDRRPFDRRFDGVLSGCSYPADKGIICPQLISC